MLSFLILEPYFSIDVHLDSIFQFQHIAIKTLAEARLESNFSESQETVDEMVIIFNQFFKPICIFLNAIGLMATY